MASSSSRERFLRLDQYRVEREWKRYEGSPQRDLFRTLRERFLRRHSASSGWTVEIGPGPGRFSPLVGQGPVRRVLMDLSQEMLRQARRNWKEALPGHPVPHLIRGDGARPPIRLGTIRELVAIGNALGFSGDQVEVFWSMLLGLPDPEGRVLLEAVAGSGTRSRYLMRLPIGSVRRLLSAPLALVTRRVLREGFEVPRETKETRHGFRRFVPQELRDRLSQRGFEISELMAVAPALGAAPDRLKQLQSSEETWARLVELEELLGREVSSQPFASALLVAARRGNR